MKRHPALRPLSDDHHRSLVLARQIRRAGERAAGGELAEGTWRNLRARFAGELEPHFRVEERVLLPALEAAGEGVLAERTRSEHARLRELVAAEPCAEAAVAFGTLLHDHVRFEERVLFPRAEVRLDPTVLEAAGAEIALRRREHGHCGMT